LIDSLSRKRHHDVMSRPPSDWVEPLESLEYVTPRDRNPRPGVLTAVGVLSIIVGAASLLASAAGGFMAFGMLMATKVVMPPLPATMPTTARTARVTPVVRNGTLVLESDGFDAKTVRMVADVFDERRKLNAARRQQLEELLSQSGQTIFPVPGGGPPTADYIDNNISSDGAAGNRSVYFVVGTGRIELSDQSAIFRPRRSGSVITVYANSTPSTAAATPSSRPARARPTTMPNPFANVNPTAAMVTVAENVVSAALAIYLMVIGGMVLRDHPAGAKVHWIYIAIKLPLIVVGAVAMSWLYSGLLAGFNNMLKVTMPPGSPPMPALGTRMAAAAVVGALFSAAYPIGLIFVLLSRKVRDFYGAVIDLE
jgi:hypothetical protein